MIPIDKELIKQRFAKSITSYNKHAQAQQQIAKTLAKMIANNTKGIFTNVLEIGAGTGFLTNELLTTFEIQNIVCNDMVKQYKDILQEKVKNKNTEFRFIACDLENTDNFANNYDLITSASTLQWIVDLDKLFAQLSKKINKQGTFAFSTFGKQNLIEFREILSQGLYYPNLEILLDIVKKYFKVCDFYEEQIVLYFENPIDVLKHIKYTGVNSLIRSKLTKQKLSSFNTEYTNKYSTSQGVKLTYNPIYIIAKNI